MKKFAIAGTALALFAAAGSAMAENGLNTGTFGLSVDTLNSTNPIVQGKYVVSRNLAILGGAGFTNTSGTGGGTNWGIMAGARYYVKSEDLAPFIGGRFNYNSYNLAAGVTGVSSAWSIGVEAGAEYFLNRHFSVEGRVGLGVGSTTVQTPSVVVLGVTIPGTSTSVTTIGTTTAALAANFYF